MSLRKSFIFLVLLFPLFTYAELKEKQFEINKHSDSIFVLVGKGYGTNMGIAVGDKGLLLIDPMPGKDFFGELHSLIKGSSNRPILYVVNTHDHEDHTGGNEYFKSNGATIISPKNLRVNSSSGTASDNKKSLLSKDFGLEIINVKSHTNHDDLYFHPASNILFVGDVFENSWHPTFYAGGIAGFTKSINTILAIGDKNTLIVPGHGMPANKKVVKAFYENTLVWLQRISVLHKEQMSLEQIMKDDLINEILQRFNTEQRKQFIPEKAFRRFIEKTTSMVSAN